MHVTDLERLYEYNYWANTKLLGVVAQLTPEQYTQSIAGSYGSIRNTLVHVMSAEWGWLDRCGGAKRGEGLKPEGYPTAASPVAEGSRVEGRAPGFLSRPKDEDLARGIGVTLARGPTPD